MTSRLRLPPTRRATFATGSRARAILLALLGSLLIALPASAQGLYQDGAVGYDISFPQCGGGLPAATAANGAPNRFGIVGVNRGKAFTHNPCLAEQDALLVQNGLGVSFYLNLNAPNPGLNPTAQSDPLGWCDPQMEPCGDYEYGWNAARDAYTFAAWQLAQAGLGAVPASWWLDIETNNYWLRDPSRNDQIIQGAIDFLREQTTTATSAAASPLVAGVYSRPTMWRRIAGSTYQPAVPTWVAGADTLDAANRLCAPISFSGGPVWLVQNIGSFLDGDYACPGF